MGGYVGRYLEVDLASETITELSVSPEVQRKYLGGSGLAAHLFFLRGKHTADPLGPDNDLFVLTGPISGTLVPGSSRFAVAARSPLTGIWGEGSCGGDFAPALKRCGVDGLVFVGQASRPVMLVLDGGEVALRDAGDLWGLDTYETTDRLRETMGGKKRPSVLSIGPAGENLVRFACIANNKHDFIGRSGMGAVMGSKRLKAVVCRGEGKIPIADEAGYKAICKEMLGRISQSVPAQALKEMGTDSAMDLGMMIGDIPIRNWSRGEDFDLSNALSGPTMSETYLKRGLACYACPIACRREVEVKEGPYQTAVGPGPEFETCAAFGAMLDQKSLAGVIKSNEWCNRYGVDSISAGCTIAWAYDCFEKGLLTLEDTGGLALEFGNVDGAIALLHKIARREGVGDLLAEGSRGAARKLGRGSEELTAEIKGLEIPMHDPRASHGLALSYMTSYRGACHKAHLVEAIEHGLAGYTGVGLEENYDGMTSEGKAPMVRIGEDLGVPLNALALCEFEMWCYQFDDLVRAIRAVTGWDDFSLEEYRATGERLWLLKRALNNLMGVTRADDRLPAKIRTPVPDGAAAGIVPDEALLLGEYYEVRGLDETGT
ncbi:MAG: aldehyde ferredoxin oxidoreductase family protein, partial [Thermoanaerobaculia bacterium]|nr:aldehyde ferredoxin oxidoreductase family protein [Thermoanaerobaculia bacterium]